MRNAVVEMATLVASLHDRQGRIQVAGYGDDATPISNAVRVAAAALPFDETEFYGNIGGTAWGDPNYTPRELTTIRPTIELNGMWGGYTGAGTKTVLPSEAHAKITMRLAPGMDPARARATLRAHLESHAPDGVTLSFCVPKDGGTPAPTLPDDHPLLLAAFQVQQTLHGRPPVVVRSGGTLPVSAIFREMLGIDTWPTGLAMPGRGCACPERILPPVLAG